MAFNSLLEAFESLNQVKREQPSRLSPEARRQLQSMRNEIEHVLFQRNPDPGADRRESLRVPVALSARYWTANELKDRYIPVLGEGGLFVSTVDPLPVGSEIDLEIFLAKRDFTLPVKGKVVWINMESDPAKHGMGIKFVDLTYEQKSVIYDLVSDSIRGRLLERRQYTRLDSRLPTQFVYQEGTFRLSTADLSADGMFVASDHLIEKGERVKVTLTVPGNWTPVRAVARVVRAEERRTPGLPAGIGLRFLMIDPEGREAILNYMVGRVAGSFHDQKAKGEHRFHPRIKRRIKVKYTSAQHAGTSYSRDISSHGVFFQTHEPPPLGSNVAVTIEHPGSGQALPLSGKVVRVVSPSRAHSHRLPGAAVLFGALTPAKQTMLQDFLKEFVLLENGPIPGTLTANN